jgi:hypothetical protein
MPRYSKFSVKTPEKSSNLIRENAHIHHSFQRYEFENFEAPSGFLLNYLVAFE